MLRRQTRHVLFTEPSELQAGQDMTVFYNPSNTCLSGCSDIFLTVRPRLIPTGGTAPSVFRYILS